ncbi:hypothetical protein [Leptospira ryugenii]|uniref:hypothetical protein n=1 Tax=Leptospira ryugenii TaxID=1917863 RepID=UPI000D5A1CDC|nr:hypothetical protein [Leptospira ryugenii]
MRVSSLLFLIVFIAACNGGKDELEKRNNETSQVMLLLSYSRSLGNCKKTTKTNDKENSVCSRWPSGLCNHDLLFFTSGEISKLLSDGNDIIKQNANCSDAFAQSGIFSLRTSTYQEQDNVIRDNRFEVIDNCVSPVSARLATFEELVFLSSAKGRIGKAATTLQSNLFLSAPIRGRSTDCLRTEFSENERKLLEDWLAKRVLEEANIQ